MLSWSGRRRVFYLLIVAIVLAAILVLAFWRLRPTASCFDRRQNQDEQGIDCGGSCAQVCLTEIAPLRVVWTRLLTVAPGQYDAATLVVNPNRAYGASRFDYLLRVIDSQGILITTSRGQAELNPGESFIVYQPRLTVGQRRPSRAVLEIVGLPTWQASTAELPAFSFQQKDFTDTPFPRLVAEITNQTLSEWRNLEVLVLLADSTGNAFAVSSTVLEFLGPQARAELAFTWPAPLGVSQPVIHFYPHLNLLTE